MSERTTPDGPAFSDDAFEQAFPTSQDKRLDELLAAWEESVASRRPLSIADLCRDCPELAAEVEHRIRRLKAIDRFMFPNACISSDTLDGDFLFEGPISRFPTLPGYEILEELGKGGMGVVYKARQLSLGRLVAVKTLAGGRWGQPGFVVRLRQEAQALSRLNDRHVVKVIDVVETADAISLVLEYVDGVNLAKRQNGAPLPVREAAQLAQTLAETLARVHAEGLLHRDIKPANVLIDTAGEIKITDFGLAKEAGATDGLTVTGDVLGSPGYMAPEQALGQTAAIDVRTDVYALGATLYELLTGRRPFVGASVIETLDQVRKQEPVTPRLLNPAVPQDLETICLKCLEKQPARRFAAARELADELGRYLRGEPIHSRPIGAIDRVLRWCRRRPARAGFIGLSAAATVVIVALLASHNRNLTKLNADLDAAVTAAKHNQILAESSERDTKERLYASDINHAVISRKAGDLRAMTELLNGCIPKPGEPDLRGFGWWLLNRQAHVAHQVLLDCKSPLYILCYSPDRRLLAAAGMDAVVRLIEMETGKISREIPTGQVEVNGVAFSPDGNELATAGDDGTIRVWNLATGAERLQIAAHPQKSFQLLYTPDGNRIVCCGNDPQIEVFAADSGRKIQTIEGHDRTVQSLFLADDRQTFVSASDDKTARVWDVDTGAELSCIRSKDFVWPVILDVRRGMLILGTDQGGVETWNIRERRKVSEVKHLDGVVSLALHPQGHLLATGDRGGTIREWQLSAGGEINPDQPRAWQAHRGRVHSLVYTGDGSRLISAGGDGRVVDWNLRATGLEISAARVAVESANSFGLIPNTDSLVTSSGFERGLTRWNWKTGSHEARLAKWNLGDARVSPDGRLVVATQNAKIVSVFSLDDAFHRQPQEPGILDWNPGGTVGATRFSPDSQTVAVRFQPDGTDGINAVRQIWLHGPPHFTHSERIPVAAGRTAAYSPDGRRLTIVTDTGLVQWDLSDRSIIWDEPQPEVFSLACSPDGKFLATGGVDRLAIIRSAQDGTIRYRLTSHRARINSLAFSRDGRTLATTSDDGVIKLWHLPTGQELFEVRSSGPPCSQLEFAPDGHRLFALTSNPEPDQDEILIFDATDVPEENSSH